jgi:hypothetical protein
MLETADLRRRPPTTRRRRRTREAADCHQSRGRGPGRALRGDSRIQRGRPSPAHRHFGSATSRTRTPDATGHQPQCEPPPGFGSSPSAPTRRSRQGAAPHRTNDLDGDKRRRTLQGAETTPLTQRGTGMQRTRFACADADIIPYDERLTARAYSRSMFESTTPHHRKRIPLRMLDAVLPDLLAHQPERRGPRGTVRSVDFRSRFADSSRRCRAHSHPAHFPGVVGRRIMPGACAVSHAWSPALVAAWGWSVVELVSDPGSGGDVMGD